MNTATRISPGPVVMRRGLIRTIAAGTVVAVALAVALVAGVLGTSWAKNRVRAEAVAFLEARFDASVEIDELSLRLVPSVSVTGRGLRLVRDGRVPFIRIDRFSAAGSPLRLLRRQVGAVEIDGLELQVARGAGRSESRRKAPRRDVRVDRIEVRQGVLLIVPDQAGKLPLRFDLEEVVMNDFSFEGSAPYAARLTNPKPTGRIDSVGRFGPWNTEEPRQTPLSGTYLFERAQLDTIKGIGGTLTSRGQFGGVLGRIAVEGTTTTPDFQLAYARQPIRLDTRFQATVDGTSGDTYLEEVHATLGESLILARGSVAGAPGAKGRTIALDVQLDQGRLEDFLRLAVKAPESPMVGVIGLKSAFELPPGEASVPERLRMVGTFTIRQGRFTSDTVQTRIDELSRRGRGQPGNAAVENVASSFGGAFRLDAGRLALPRLQFRVGGADVALAGSYRLESEMLDFAGTLRLDAPLSRTTTGVKSLLLRGFDPFFRKPGAGTQLAIKIGGTVDKPAFGLDLKRTLRGP